MTPRTLIASEDTLRPPMSDSPQDPSQRVLTLLGEYSDPRASAAELLCDRHDPQRIAYTLVGADLQSVDLTYGSLRTESERLASALSSLGLGAGDRIATLMGKSRAYLITLMAIWRLGAVHVPLFTAFAPPAIAFRLFASGAKLVVCDSNQRAKLADSAIPEDAPWRVVTAGDVETDTLCYEELMACARPGFGAAALGGDAPIIQIFTSGTTGTPKGVLVPLRALASFQIYAEYALALRGDDVFWNAADPGWAYGLYLGVLVTLATGVRGILLESGFSATTTLAVLSQHRVTNFAAAPTVFRALRASGLAPSGDMRLRCISSAGEPLTPDVSEWSRKVLGAPVHDHYGQTETGMLINNHHHPLLSRPLKSGSMGQPLPGWTATVLQPDRDEPAPCGTPGRLAIKLTESPLAWFDGYVNEPARNSEKFSADHVWYFTGDSSYSDAEGDYYFFGREDDVILMAGYRIGPVEVESVLLAHPAVSECAVVAVPDEIRGEVLEAVVVLRAERGPSEALSCELQEWVKRRYAAHAYPRQVHYVESLPKTPSGKVQRFILRQQLEASSRSPA
jgi:acetyl-CoA synthetase